LTAEGGAERLDFGVQFLVSSPPAETNPASFGGSSFYDQTCRKLLGRGGGQYELPFFFFFFFLLVLHLFVSWGYISMSFDVSPDIWAIL